ncbi:hypothetical protein [Actinocorallia libanotica]|uniref:WD40 repeat protein n=1 Tax=Actinocorallia libanotica TaxID=46162 RepID=A0ABN1QAF4_9ACTN
MNVEDRLKAALHGTAGLVEDRPRPLPTAARRRRIPRFVPVWAALIVALVMLGPFVLPDGESNAPIPMSSPSLAIGSAPEIYVAIYGATKERKSRFEIRSTATGELRQVNEAGNGESFVSIAAIPDDGKEGISSFYLLTRLGAGTLPGCTKYTVYGLQISADAGFSSWGGSTVTFEAVDGTPANLATTPKGDEIAYSFEGCGRKVIEGDTERYVGGVGVPGVPLFAHHWAGATTTWNAGGKVLNLAYSPDGHSLAMFRLRDAEAGREAQRELLLMRTANPDDTTTLLRWTEESGIRKDGAVRRPINAMISPDGKKVVVVFSGPDGSGTRLSVAERPIGGKGLSFREPLTPVVDHPVDGPVLVKQHPSGPELLLQAGATTLFHGGKIKAVIPSIEETPADIAW